VRGRARLASLLAGAAPLLAALALLDPARAALAPAAIGLALAALAAAPRERRRRAGVAALLALGLATAALCPIEFRADSASYFVYLRSAFIDGDLDFANEWRRWGYPEAPLTPTGRRRNVHAVGPALLWSPFYAAAHAYVRAGATPDGVSYAADGYATPYRRAAAVGTVLATLLGALLLARALAREHGPLVAALASAACVLASPILYYALIVPTMAHGAAFGAAAAFVWAWHEARRVPTLSSWLWLGALLGLVVLMRWQAVVYVLLVVPLLVSGLRARSVRPAWPLLAAGAALAVFTPQLAAWQVLYGRPVTLPQGDGFVDWSSPHLLDTLVSADHGLFTWTPLLALGALGLVLGLRRDAGFSAPALLVFAAVAWVNGGVADWAAGSAFGARRYDVVVPLLAAGLAELLAAARPALVRAPLALPALLLAIACAWNVGFVAAFRAGRYPEVAPIERLAHDQALGLRRAAEWTLGALFGARGRALAYRALSGEYVYTGNPAGTIALADADERVLLGGWGTRARRADGPPYRWALYPRACLRLALEQPFELPVSLTIRAPGRAGEQRLTLSANGRAVGAAAVGPEWRELPFLIPAAALLPGENELCLGFSTALPGEDGTRAAAAVATLQLP
jgi:hypothetical protein